MTGPIKYPGGKQGIAGKIVDLMPRHLTYLEPYCGGCAVLLARDPEDERFWWSRKPGEQGVSEVICDIDGELTNFWRVLQDEASFAAFRRRVEAIPFSGIEYQACEKLRDDPDPIVRAVAFFVVARQSLAGRMQGFAAISMSRTRSHMNEQVSAWLSCVDGLPAVHARLRRVLVLPPQPAFQVIEKFDRPDVFMYLDPPYHPETRVTTHEYGPHEMTIRDHRRLVNRLFTTEAKIILSGYANPLYDNALQSWDRIEIRVDNKASHQRTKPIMTEVLWKNF